MAFYDRFRNRQQSVLPKEVKQYYQSEQRQRRGAAIGLALLALVVTVAIAAALFFGGRWVYRTITGNDDNRNGTVQTDENAGDFGALDEEQPRDQQPNGQPQTPNPTPTTPQPQPAPAPATPSLGDEPLPHTGDPGM